MNNIINTINEKIKAIIAELEQNKNESEDALALVQSKIDNKIDEAKNYKIDVDNAKEKIKGLEEDINNLEKDLNDLNERFGNKDLNAILDAGNKEINARILDKQKEITKYREKIGELTEKARAIKDLLINLKKDKETKENKDNEIGECLNYYKSSLTKIVDFADEHSDDLTFEPEVTNYKVEDAPAVFDEIESMDKEEEPITEEVEPEAIGEEPVVEETHEEPLDESVNIFDNDPTQKIDFKTINDTIDKEYENIFGDAKDISLEPPVPPVVAADVPNRETSLEPDDNPLVLNEEPTEEHSGLTQTDIFGNDYKPEVTDDDTELVNFFTNYGIDFYSFAPNDQIYLKGVFNPEMCGKVIEVLKNNNIDLNKVYEAPSIFGESTPADLEHMISKLLLAGQTTQNIGCVLNTLPLINSFDLNEVIESYGPSIKDANITDLIIKAKHLNDIGGGVQ